MNSVPLGHLVNDLATLFELGYLANPPNVPLIVGKRPLNKYLDQLENFLLAVLASADGCHVCIVVVTSQSGRIGVPDKRSPYAFYLVCGNLLTVADARLDHRLFAGFIISLCGNFFLKQFRCGHLLSNAKKHRTISNAGTRQASAPAISARADFYAG